MASNHERSTERRTTWFAQQLGDGWRSEGDGIYYPPEPERDIPELAVEMTLEPLEAQAPAASRRRTELMQLRERLVERVARFPNAVAERQLREIETELARLVRRIGPFHVPRPS